MDERLNNPQTHTISQRLKAVERSLPQLVVVHALFVLGWLRFGVAFSLFLRLLCVGGGG